MDRLYGFCSVTDLLCCMPWSVCQVDLWIVFCCCGNTVFCLDAVFLAALTHGVSKKFPSSRGRIGKEVTRVTSYMLENVFDQGARFVLCRYTNGVRIESSAQVLLTNRPIPPLCYST
jgi:hypothetical protein